MEIEGEVLDDQVAMTCKCGFQITYSELEGHAGDSAVYDDVTDDEEDEASLMELHWAAALRRQDDKSHLDCLSEAPFNKPTTCHIAECGPGVSYTNSRALLTHWCASNDHGEAVDELAYLLSCIYGGGNDILPKGIQEDLLREDMTKLRVMLGYDHEGFELDDFCDADMLDFLKRHGVIPEHFDFELERC